MGYAVNICDNLQLQLSVLCNNTTMYYALVDDDSVFHQVFKDKLMFYDPSAEIMCFENGNAFIGALNSIPFDAVFLDIEMPGLNGMQIAEYLHSQEYACLVAYITNRSDAVLDAYGLNVIGFIEKRNIDSQLPKVLMKIKNEISQNEYLSIKLSSDGAVRIRKKTITLIEKSGRSVILHTVSGETYTTKKMTLQELNSALNSDSFAYTDRSAIVNLKEVVKASKIQVYVRNHDRPVYISKYRRKEFMQLLLKEMKL